MRQALVRGNHVVSKVKVRRFEQCLLSPSEIPAKRSSLLEPLNSPFTISQDWLQNHKNDHDYPTHYCLLLFLSSRSVRVLQWHRWQQLSGGEENR